MFPKQVWLIFIILIIAYGFVIQEGEGLSYLSNAPRLTKHIVHVAFLIFFFLTGYLGWRNYHEKWTARIWILFYSSVFIILGIGGLIDLISKIDSLQIRFAFGYFRLFCTSPMPYIICMLLVMVKNNISKRV